MDFESLFSAVLTFPLITSSINSSLSVKNDIGPPFHSTHVYMYIFFICLKMSKMSEGVHKLQKVYRFLRIIQEINETKLESMRKNADERFTRRE